MSIQEDSQIQLLNELGDSLKSLQRAERYEQYLGIQEGENESQSGCPNIFELDNGIIKTKNDSQSVSQIVQFSDTTSQTNQLPTKGEKPIKKAQQRRKKEKKDKKQTKIQRDKSAVIAHTFDKIETSPKSRMKLRKKEELKQPMFLADEIQREYLKKRVGAKQKNELVSQKVVVNVHQPTETNEKVKHNKLTKVLKRDDQSQIYVCLTGFDRDEEKELKEQLTELPHVFPVESVDSMTTHVVSKSSQKTIKAMMGICRGCWILNEEWIEESLLRKCPVEERWFCCTFSNGKPVPERKLRIFHGLTFRVGYCGVTERTLIISLIKLCGGKITNDDADYDIGIMHGCVALEWLYQSIMTKSMLDHSRFIVS
ncbi:hypothetical protein EIN_369710 [Entamoeba invadens IP1]|uniref:BRCT domain-containing protein n=1 Tax=Entamoeba invadens IP1 TaxID=370355 RepID=A0A0A1UFD5_ENTIV|nr:hypothetical protein EIN_369710 [Entamoeba invadens IP1]ELP92649.1 hypothetical protein EIN_369710 [Entamoeba invadens IP1]|eukprot:XP_004259420.1 hypothetical protein EIN_369710 [Entamoeba invadens IP1]